MLAKAIASYNAQNPSEMSFNINQLIEISSCDEYWCISNGLNFGICWFTIIITIVHVFLNPIRIIIYLHDYSDIFRG